MAAMTGEAMAAFLDERRQAVVATLNADGSAQLSPVWYVMDRGKVFISTSERSVKMRNLRRDARISVCVDGGRGDSRYVVFTGKVKIVENGEALQTEMRWRIIRKYHDSDESARAYFDAAADGSQVILVLEPERVTSNDFN